MDDIQDVLDDNTDVLTRLKRQLASPNRVIPFVGAGLSMTFGCPGWAGFLRKVADKIGERAQVDGMLQRSEFEEAADLLIQKYGETGFYAEISMSFGRGAARDRKLDGVLALLPDLTAGPIATTNFDRLIERAFEARALTISVIRGADVDSGSTALMLSRPCLLKLHGDAEERNGRILTGKEYERHYGPRVRRVPGVALPLPGLLARLMSGQAPLLFLGCSLIKDRTLDILKGVQQATAASGSHFAFVQIPADSNERTERRKFFSRHGIHPIWYPAGQHHLIARVLELALADGGRAVARSTQAVRPHDHWDLSARGVEAGPGSYFTGRKAALATLATWIKSPDERGRVVTGSPGCGKSSILGLLVALSNSRLRETLSAHVAAECDPGVSTITVAVHARAKTVHDVAGCILEQLGGAADFPGQPTESDIASAVSGRESLSVIVVDALDEAQEPRHVASFLRKLTYQPTLRLLIGTRHEFLPALGPRTQVLDLDDSIYFDQADVAEYVEKRLLCSAEPDRHTPYRGKSTLAKAIAERVARRANRVFLVARLFADSLVEADVVISPEDPELNKAHPAGVDEAFRGYLERLGEDEPRARQLLTILAFGQGAGLPMVDLWSMAARTVWGRPYDNGDTDWVRERCSSYIITEEADGEFVCRLYHAEMASYLATRHRTHAKTIHRSLLEAIETLVTQRAAESWVRAAKTVPYARRHLAAHAAVVGTLDRLLKNPGYLVTAEPDSLLMQLQRASDSRREIDVYTRAADMFRTLSADEALTMIDWLSAVCKADELKLATEALAPRLLLKTRWADLEVTPHLTLRQRDLVFSLKALNFDGRPILCAACGDQIRLLDGRTGNPVNEPFLGHEGPATSLAVLEWGGEPVLASGGWDSTIRFWSAKTGATVRPALAIGEGQVEHLESMMTSGGWTLAWSTEKASSAVRRPDALQLWDAQTRQLMVAPEPMSLLALFELLGRPAVLAQNAGGIYLWNGERPPALLQLEGGIPEGVSCGVVFDDGGETIVALGTDDGPIHLFGLEKRAALGELTGHTAGVTCLAAVATETGAILASGSWDTSVRLWEWRKGKPLAGPLRGHSDHVTSIASFTRDGRVVLASGSQDMSIRFWELDAIREGAGADVVERGTADGLAACVLDGTPVVVVGGSRGLLTVRSVRDGSFVRAPFPNKSLDRIGSVAVIELDGSPIVVCGSDDGVVSMWNLATGQQVGDPLLHPHSGVSLPPATRIGEFDGRPVIVSAYAGEVRVWDARDRELRAFSKNRDGSAVWDAALFTLDRRPMVVTAHDGGTIRRWDVRTAKQVGPPTQAEDWRITSVASFVLHERPIIVSGGDRVRLWDAGTGEPIGEPLEHSQNVACVSVVRLGDSLLIAAGSFDETLRLWDASTRKLRATLFVTAPVHSLCCLGTSDLVIGTSHGVGLVSVG